MPTAFEAATAQRDEIDAALRKATADLNALTDYLSGNAPRVMGLTPDFVKANADWQLAKAKADTLFQALRQFNAYYVRTFKKELAADRKARRYSLSA